MQQIIYKKNGSHNDESRGKKANNKAYNKFTDLENTLFMIMF